MEISEAAKLLGVSEDEVRAIKAGLDTDLAEIKAQTTVTDLYAGRIDSVRAERAAVSRRYETGELV